MSSKQKIDPRDYWTAIRNVDRVPNFWMTPEYARKADLVWVNDDNLWGWFEKGEQGWFLPPLGPEGFRYDRQVWAGFASGWSYQGDFLDEQYLYDARKFLNLKGKHWATFRKNIRKYPARTKGKLEYEFIRPNDHEDQVEKLLMEWSEGRELNGPDTLIRFCLRGMRRWGLFNDGILVGLNVADANHRHGIYRYCLDDGTPFLNEYLRYCFFTSTWAQRCVWINDGGSLGSKKLARFKKKLNPVAVYKVHSYYDPRGE